jgi:hypothetical protein
MLQEGYDHAEFGPVGFYPFFIISEFLKKITSPQMRVIAVTGELWCIQAPEMKLHFRKTIFYRNQVGMFAICIKADQVNSRIVIHERQSIFQALKKPPGWDEIFLDVQGVRRSHGTLSLVYVIRKAPVFSRKDKGDPKTGFHQFQVFYVFGFTAIIRNNNFVKSDMLFFKGPEQPLKRLAPVEMRDEESDFTKLI